jgi:hypothetical protein
MLRLRVRDSAVALIAQMNVSGWTCCVCTRRTPLNHLANGTRCTRYIPETHDIDLSTSATSEPLQVLRASLNLQQTTGIMLVQTDALTRSVRNASRGERNRL